MVDVVDVIFGYEELMVRFWFCGEFGFVFNIVWE